MGRANRCNRMKDGGDSRERKRLCKRSINYSSHISIFLKIFSGFLIFNFALMMSTSHKYPPSVYLRQNPSKNPINNLISSKSEASVGYCNNWVYVCLPILNVKEIYANL